MPTYPAKGSDNLDLCKLRYSSGRVRPRLDQGLYLASSWLTVVALDDDAAVEEVAWHGYSPRSSFTASAAVLGLRSIPALPGRSHPILAQVGGHPRPVQRIRLRGMTPLGRRICGLAWRTSAAARATRSSQLSSCFFCTAVASSPLGLIRGECITQFHCLPILSSQRRRHVPIGCSRRLKQGCASVQYKLT